MGNHLSRLPRVERPTLIQLFLVVLWVSLLSWGERGAFGNSATSCHWNKWEEWPTEAQPHHVLFVADPQLVDPHTYPGRPWPLSTFTIRHTDQYLRRSFTAILKHIRPQTVLFLGDLFDGGREWSTKSSKSPEERWHKYGDDFWLQEYERFQKIFMDPWAASRKDNTGTKARLLANLPGNHDLGFSNGIQLPVRARFQTFFGQSNRIDMIGNHSFVSVDTVSLSARAHQQPGKDNKAVWKPAEQFLDQAKTQKSQAVERELQTMFKKGKTARYNHVVVDADELDGKKHADPVPKSAGELPTVLLSHVPLYRADGTPCGPLRERWPPTNPTADPAEKDERNAIRVHAGYQYQNVLDVEITKELVDKIGGIVHAFSGDDHDYCDVVHRGYSSKGGGIREVTVKSLSWAMGVRKPGYLLLSLWNPIDENGNSLSQSTPASAPTTQTRLCLLPDQLGIFIRYLNLFIFTIALLAFDSLLVSISSKSKSPRQEPILPLNSVSTSKAAKTRSRADSSSCSTSSNSDEVTHLASRMTAFKPRAPSPSKGYAFGVPEDPEEEKPGSLSWSYSNGKHNRTSSRAVSLTKPQLFLGHFRKSMLHVASIGLLWYSWLALTV